MLLSRALGFALATTLSGCFLFEGEGPVPDCGLDGPVDAEIVFADQTGVLHDVATATSVPLISAPQGGHILLIGARLRAPVKSCQVDINAALRDPTTNLVLGLEQRPMTIANRGGEWASPADPAGLSDVANVAVCPTESTTGIHGQPATIEVRIMSVDGVTLADVSATITPMCSSTNSYCMNECGP